MMRILTSGFTITILVALAFSLLVWFIGPLISFGEATPFASILGRAITVGIIVFIALAVALIIVLRRGSKAKKMEEEIVESVEEGADTDDEVVREELKELKVKLKDAMVTLRKSKTGSGSLYELPWYIMIGPSGAGKTTAIRNSGLDFPKKVNGEGVEVKGVGGTMNVDWWFTNEAVLIDTAGRFTTQDMSATEDNAGWLGFLNMLRRNRARQPINGAIIAISLSDLSELDAATQKDHAAAVRARLHELRDKLGVRFPVYVMFTKADLIAGFTEYFDTPNRDDLEQVWGFTLPLVKKPSKKDPGPIEAFDAEFGALLAQVNAQLVDRLQRETNHERRALISNFPSQFASVRMAAKSFLGEVFGDNRFEKRHMLRGVYFASGTQEGTPIDRLMMGMANTFGIGRQAIGKGRGSGRAFFIKRLFEEVIFPEAGIVSSDDRTVRRYRWTKRIAVAAALLGGAGVTGLWARSYMGNSDLISSVAQGIDTYEAQAALIQGADGSPVEDGDLPSVVPALNTLRAIPVNPAQGEVSPEGKDTYGLYQGRALGNQAALAYRDALNQHLLPRLLLRLEDQVLANSNNPDVLYESLKVYLMLGKLGPLNRDSVKDWLTQDWALSYAGPARETLRADLLAHVSYMLDNPLDTVALDGDIIARARDLLRDRPPSQRVFGSIIESPQAEALPPWRLTEIGGPSVDRVLQRSTGKRLSEGIPGIFTYAGFRDVFLPEALSVSERIQSEQWVLADSVDQEPSPAASAAVARDVLALYYDAFVAQYEGILGEVDIVPLENESQAAEVTGVLSGSTSPLVNILNAISQETKLTEDRSSVAGIDTSGAAEGASSIGRLVATSNLSQRQLLVLGALGGSVGTGGTGAPPPAPGQFVEDRFSWLHDLTAELDGQPSQLSEWTARLTQVHQVLNNLLFNPSGEDAGQAISALQAFAANLPGPLQRWTAQIAGGSSEITAGGTRSSISAKWQSDVLPFCQRALDNRYPFTRGASADVAMGDFERLFKPNGLIDTFITENLIQFVDTSGRDWAWKPLNGADLGISQQVLTQMQYASEIRDAFFAGNPTPAASFQMTPEALDPNANEVTLEIDGQEIAYAHSVAPRPTAVTWPGPVGSARIVLQPPANNSSNVIAKDGPWAWFRLLSAAEVVRTNASDRNRVIFTVGGRVAIFQLQSGSVLNPFGLAALDRFSCPTSF